MLKTGSSEKDFVIICHVKKACLGEGGRLERTLDDVIGTGSTVRSCFEAISEKLCLISQGVKNQNVWAKSCLSCHCYMYMLRFRLSLGGLVRHPEACTAIRLE